MVKDNIFTFRLIIYIRPFIDTFSVSMFSEPVPLFPLFNEIKKEYVPSQIYRINPVRKKQYGKFPTVSTILSQTMSQNSKMLLNRWKENQVAEFGQEKFNEQQKSKGILHFGN